MAKFCGVCGNPLSEASAFCGACGARVQQVDVPPAEAVCSLPSVSPLAPVAKGSNPVIKIALVVAVLLVAGGAISLVAIFYAVHIASRKAHEFSRQVLGGGIISSLPATGESAKGTDGGTIGTGDCRFLSKEDVSREIGVRIVATKTTADGCEYFAKGTSADMTAKHIAAMMSSRGANAQQQKLLRNLSRGLLGNTANGAEGNSQNTDVNSVVMTFTIDPNSVKTQMSMNENVLGAVGPGRNPLKGIGDEAFDTDGAVMMVRKGDKLIRITYSSCPCTVDAIKPLARELAGEL